MRGLLSTLICLLGITACHQPDPKNYLKVGTIAGPETELMEVAQQVAKKDYNLNIKIVEFTDYRLPNEALADGSLDANVYQHLPYLEAAMQANGYKLAVIGKTFIYPMGVYSAKVKSLDALPEHALIAIPNDPSNTARALLLLEKAHLLELNNDKQPSIKDITVNPKQLRFKELDAAQLPRILPDVDAAIINTTFAIPAGLSPTKDALLSEDKDSPYVNLIVAQQNSPKKDELENLVKALNSDAVAQKAHQLFGDGAIPAWQ